VLLKLVDHYLRALEAKDFEQRRLASESPKSAGKPAGFFLRAIQSPRPVPNVHKG
jgi:hypothetical protein